MANNSVQFQWKYLSQGELWYVNGWYYPDPFPAAIDLDDAHTGVNNLATMSLSFLCDTTTLVSVTTTLRGTPNSGRTKTSHRNTPGLVTGTEELPVWVTASFKKWPQEDSIEPAGQPAFRPGRFSFSGIPETAQEDGQVEAIYQATTDTFCSNVLEIITPTMQVLKLSLVRDPDPDHLPEPIEFARAFVAEVELSRIGSQLTRKN